MESNNLKLLAEKIKDFKIAMLTTVEEDGSLCSRPMATIEIQNDNQLWFFTKTDTLKIHEIQSDAHVNISYMNESKELYISVGGTAQVVKDKAKIKELWSPVLKAWFPEGENDPEITLLKVKINKAQYWDAPGNRVIQLIGMAKAVITGKEYKPGENKKIKA